jgi:cell division protein ZapB
MELQSSVSRERSAQRVREKRNAITRVLLTLDRRGSILRRMTPDQANTRVDLELKRLEKRLEELVVVCRQLQEENKSLRHRQDSLMSERATLLHKNEQVRGRVEAMIGRLKGMEQVS